MVPLPTDFWVVNLQKRNVFILGIQNHVKLRHVASQGLCDVLSVPINISLVWDFNLEEVSDAIPLLSCSKLDDHLDKLRCLFNGLLVDLGT